MKLSDFRCFCSGRAKKAEIVGLKANVFAFNENASYAFYSFLIEAFSGKQWTGYMLNNFREVVAKIWKFQQKGYMGTSLTTNIAVIENKASSVKKYLKILERYKKYSKQELESDVDIRGALERYLYLAAQATIDLSEAVVAHKEFRKPSAMSESFYILEEEDVIPAALAEKLAGMAGFRNVIAHDYEKINYDIVHEVLHKGLGDIEEFLEIVKNAFHL